MKRMNKKGEFEDGTIFFFVAFFIIILLVGAIYGFKATSVWWAKTSGEAEFAQADQNRKISVLEATAKEESAIHLAQAEVNRAKGVAEANKIIGESLKNNEDYLKYLWITDVAGANIDKTIVYIPTETNLPILEASRK